MPRSSSTAAATKRVNKPSVAQILKKYDIDAALLAGMPAAAAALRRLTKVLLEDLSGRGSHKQAADELLAGFTSFMGLMKASQWSEEEFVTVFNALAVRWQTMQDLNAVDLRSEDVLAWIKVHSDSGRSDVVERAVAVAACVEVTPPPQVRLKSRLPMTGHQKRVFDAVWMSAGGEREIVLKQFLTGAAKLIPREMQAYPLSMMHPNIIRTYRLENPADPASPFLAERKLTPLQDWRFKGLIEAACVLTDIARAIAFLSDFGLVHGDIKPDNIGWEDGRYILLDFGVCRPALEFKSSEASGSLRIRAPELLRRTAPHSAASDVWALAASIYACQFGHFPLFAKEDNLTWETDDERDLAERELVARLDRGWSQHRETLNALDHAALRSLLVEMLADDPKDRPEADVVLRRAVAELPALVGVADGPLFRPWQELEQMARYLASGEDARLMPRSKAMALTERAKTLEHGLKGDHFEELIERTRCDCVVLLGGDQLAAKDRESVKSVLAELDRVQETSQETLFEELVATVRARIDSHGEPWPSFSPDGRSAFVRLDASDSFATLGNGEFSARFRALLDALERRQVIHEW